MSGEEKGIEISECSTTGELMEWLEQASRVEVVAIAVWLNNHTVYRVPTSGTLDQLIFGLRKVKSKVLWRAINAIIPDDEETGDGEEEDYRDEGDEDESEDSRDEDEDT